MFNQSSWGGLLFLSKIRGCPPPSAAERHIPCSCEQQPGAAQGGGTGTLKGVRQTPAVEMVPV